MNCGSYHFNGYKLAIFDHLGLVYFSETTFAYKTQLIEILLHIDLIIKRM